MRPLIVGSFTVVLGGIPLQSARGAAGWASVALHEDDGTRTLLDCGGRGDALVLGRALEWLGVSPEQVDAIVLTHLHFDHAGGISLYPSAEIIVSEDEIEHARRSREDPWRDPALAPGIAEALEIRKARFVRDGDMIGRLSVVALPGHTPGSIGLVDPEGVLFAGDAVKNIEEMSIGAPRAALDMRQAIESIARIRQASFGAVIPGHDRPFTVAADTVTPLAPMRLELTLDTSDATGKPHATATFDFGGDPSADDVAG